MDQLDINLTDHVQDVGTRENFIAHFLLKNKKSFLEDIDQQVKMAKKEGKKRKNAVKRGGGSLRQHVNRISTKYINATSGLSCHQKDT